jgi:hypothetical protein
MGKMNAEARARLAAEAGLIRRHKAEYDRLLKKKERIGAIAGLVDKHKTEYGELVKTFRARFERAETAA